MNCEIVRDLLPLYEDGLCSEESRGAVEEHLKTCEACRKLLPEGPAEAGQEPAAPGGGASCWASRCCWPWRCWQDPF